MGQHNAEYLSKENKRLASQLNKQEAIIQEQRTRAEHAQKMVRECVCVIALLLRERGEALEVSFDDLNEAQLLKVRFGSGDKKDRRYELDPEEQPQSRIIQVGRA